MNCKEILIFDIKGEYGHFRKYNTTTSPLTYSIPTRTAMAGMMGAILGMEREVGDGKYGEGVIPVQEFFSKDQCGITVQVMNPVKKEQMGFNLINTGKKPDQTYYDLTHAKRTQISFELVKDVWYRVFFTHKEKRVMTELRDRIQRRDYYFSPYLGLSQFLALVSYVDLVEAKERNDNQEKVEVISAVNMSCLPDEAPLTFQSDCFYSSNNMPIAMNKDREVLEYSEVLLELTGKSMKVRPNRYVKVPGYGNIVFL